jgi:hypothetical protein
MEDLKPGVSVTTKDGDLLTAGQRVVTKDGLQGAVASITAEGEGGQKNNEVVRVMLDEPVQNTDSEKADEASRWVFYAADDLRLL